MTVGNPYTFDAWVIFPEDGDSMRMAWILGEEFRKGSGAWEYLTNSGFSETLRLPKPKKG